MPIDTPTWEDTVEEVPKWEETVEGGAESQEQLDRWAAEAWKSQPKTGFFGSFGKEFVGSIKSTARGPGPMFLSENVLKDHLLGEYAKATTAPEQTGAGKIGGFLGGLAGTIGQAIPIGMATGPAGIIAMFGSQGEYNEFLRAGMRALSEGKSPEEAVKIGRKSGLVGGAVGSALGAIMPAKPAATLAEAVAHGVKLGGAAALGRAGENIGERALGLKTPVGEDVLTEGLTMAALPPASHVVGRALRIVKPPRQPEVPAAPLPNESQQLEAIRTEIGKASRAVDIAKGIGDIDEALRAQVRLDLLLEHERKLESMVPSVAAEPTVPPKPSGAAVVPPMQTTDVVAPPAAPLTAQEIYALQRGQERGRIVPQPPKKEIQPPMRGPEEEPPPAGEAVPVEPKPPEGPAPAGATAQQPAAKAAEPAVGYTKPAVMGAFHFGDGGIARDTTLSRMDAGRSSGHFGTGIYFLGQEKPGAREGRPVKNLDLTGLNLAKPIGDDAFLLHDALRDFNRSVLENKPLNFSDIIDNGSRIANHLWLSLGPVRHSVQEIGVQMAKIQSLFNNRMNDKLRTPSTYLMQELGYDGVDVRGTRADNTDYGSVIFAKGKPTPKQFVLQQLVEKILKQGGSLWTSMGSKQIWLVQGDFIKTLTRNQVSELENRGIIESEQGGNQYDTQWKLKEDALKEPSAEPEKGVETDALQVKSPDEIPVQPTPGDRGAVAKGIPPEGEVPAGEKAQVGPEEAEVLLNEPPPVKRDVGKSFQRLAETMRDDLDAILGDWNGSRLSDDGTKIVMEETRGGGGKWAETKSDFFNWLFSDEPAKVSSEPDWIALINKARQSAKPTPAKPALGTGELPKAQPGERRKTLKEIREQNKLGGQGGFINLSPVVDAVDRLRNEIDIWFKQGKVKQAMSFKKDRANNMADRYANEHGNDVSNMLFRALKGTIKPSQQERLQAVFAPWKDPNELYKTALTVGVESFSDALPNSGEVGVTGRSRLALQRARLQTYTPPDATMARWKNKGLAAIDYAIANWNRLEPVVQRYMREMRAEADFEQAKGVDTLIRNGYVMHETDLEGRSRFDFLNPHGGGEGARWLKNRIYPTYVDKIIGNSKPVSMDAIALAKARIRSGQRKVNNAEWTQNLRNEVDPTSGKPILTDAIERTRADGKHYYDPIDQDYTLARIGYETYSVHKGYDGAFEALTDPSWFSRSLPGQSLMKLAGSTKHVVLAFDTFHLGRLAFWSSIIQGKPAGYKKGLVLLNYTMPEIQEMARRGEIPREYLADIAENKRKIDLAMKTGFNVARIQDALWQEWTQKIPGTGAFQKWLFGEFQQGAMMESWLAEFSRQKKAFSWLSEDKIARNVSKELNTRFGNLQNQGWFRSKTAQDLARLIFLAPQWNEGLIMSELKGLAGVGKTLYDAQTRQKLAVSGLTRAAGIMMLAQFAANQLINLVSRGHPTWENKEDGLDAKLSAYIPDYIGEGPGLFWSPMALPAETAHLLYKMHERTGDMDEAINSYARSRLGTVTRPIATWAFKKDAFGRSIRSEELWNEILKSAVPAPISGSAAYYAGRQVATGEKSEQFPGQFQKQSLASLGVKTETAPTATQQIGRLARKWNEARGKLPPGEFYSSPYTDLDRLLRAGNTRDALRQLDDLVKKKNLDQIFKRYEFMAEMNFTHSSEDDEADFFNTLTKDQRDAYLKARMERAQLADRFYKLWAIRQSTQPATR